MVVSTNGFKSEQKNNTIRDFVTANKHFATIYAA